METVSIYKRITHKYNDAWRHLDQEVYIGIVKLTPPKQVREANDYSDLGTYVQLARIPAGAATRTVRDLLQGLADTLSHHGCNHEHDCCGCVMVSAYATKVGKRTAMVKTTLTRNL